MMRKIFLFIIILVVCVTASWRVASTTGPAIDAHPGPPAESEFYWDDGIMASGWVWFTAGSYWAVDFDDEKTGGFANGVVTRYGAATYPNWPDSTYQGCYMHVFGDDGGYPAADLDRTYLGFTDGGSYEWVDASVGLTTSVFYIAFEQVGDYPNCDTVGVDSTAGTHNWTGYQGSWGTSTLYGDFMLRCYWEDEPGEDYLPPQVNGMDPDDGAVGVPVGTEILFHVVDNISGVDVATIELTVEDTSLNSFAVALSAGGPAPAGVIEGVLHIDDIDPLDVVCTFTPDDNLPYADAITCTVPAGLADMLGNATHSDFVWSFTTEGSDVKNSTWGEIKALY